MSPANAEPVGGFRAEDGSAWQRIRRYAVPGWMIEQATAHRLAGDWRAACAAAAVDVDFDLPDIEARYGTAVAAAVAEDLRHLAPDLLRWHLPRLLGGRTTIAPDLRIVLATYDGPGGPALSVTTPVMTEASQRLRLHCAPVVIKRNKYTGRGFVPENWTAIRPFWDARHACELGTRFAEPDGLAERIAGLRAAGDTVGAYGAAGITCDLTVPPGSTSARRTRRPSSRGCPSTSRGWRLRSPGSWPPARATDTGSGRAGPTRPYWSTPARTVSWSASSRRPGRHPSRPCPGTPGSPSPTSNWCGRDGSPRASCIRWWPPPCSPTPGR
ncbi:hypothetical protein ACFVJ8_25890 [Streptomyces yangpuensis]|uniref:hypothetical protein n=1 Tax=Streptomyces yangpuensis TaxID=1648182 RepID=UPI00362561F4